MGTWGFSVTDNDTAQDLLSEYQAAFFYNDPETAFKKIDSYVRENICDETDEEEWCNYFYSLADYMWKKGLLTDEIRDKAVQMIDSGFGMEIWRLSGEKAAAKRTAALEKFKEKLLSPQPPRKKITISLCTKPVFEVGDIIAMQLQTAGKTYTKIASIDRPMTDEEFHAFDGKFILIRKIRDDISYTSAIEPNVRDIYPVFQLFDGVYDEPPAEIKLSDLKNANFVSESDTPLFLTDGGTGRYKKRKCKVISNDKTGIEEFEKAKSAYIFLSVNYEVHNPDSRFLAAMGTKPFIDEITYPDEKVLENMASIYSSYWLREHPWLPETDENSTSKEERARHNDEYFLDVLKREFAAGKQFYAVRYGSIACFCSVHENSIENFALRNFAVHFLHIKMLMEFAEAKCSGIPKVSAYGPRGKKMVCVIIGGNWLQPIRHRGRKYCVFFQILIKCLPNGNKYGIMKNTNACYVKSGGN